MIIKDPLLNPFHIEVGNGNHTVLKATGKQDKDGNAIHTSIGYFSNMSSCLKKIVKEKVIENNNNSTLMLRDYIEEYKEENSKIINILKD